MDNKLIVIRNYLKATHELLSSQNYPQGTFSGEDTGKALTILTIMLNNQRTVKMSNIDLVNYSLELGKHIYSD